MRLHGEWVRGEGKEEAFTGRGSGGGGGEGPQRGRSERAGGWLIETGRAGMGWDVGMWVKEEAECDGQLSNGLAIG